MNNTKYHKQLGEIQALTKITTTPTNKIGQRDMKGATNDCFLFDSCFYSKNLVEALMDVGTDMIGVIKTNTKRF